MSKLKQITFKDAGRKVRVFQRQMTTYVSVDGVELKLSLTQPDLRRKVMAHLNGRKLK